jgi:TRAP-type C4-dicarboxylate transport system permease small subunit
MITALLNALGKVGEAFAHLERGILVGLVGLLAGFSLLQIILRNFFSSGLVWTDDLLRHGVLWLSFLGAARATSENKHIRIDLLPRLMPWRGRLAIAAVSSLFSFLVCLVLFWASMSFIRGERLAGTLAFAGIPYWVVEAIFPISFALMTLRFGFNLINGLVRGSHGKEP